VRTPNIRDVRYGPCAPAPRGRSGPGSTKEDTPK
jgi:hypothetical protein